MKPGAAKRWSRNALWLGGPGAGTASKTRPLASEEDDGVYPSRRPGPRKWNYLRWSVDELLANVVSLRLLNWRGTDETALIGPGTGGPCDGCGLAGVESVVDFTGAGAIEEWIAPGGLIWAAAAPGVVAGVAPRVAVDQAGNRGMALGAAGGLPAPVVFSAAYAAWAAWAGPPAGTFTLIDHDGVGLWVVADSVNAVLVSTGPAVAFAAPATPPGFAAAPVALRHSRHPAGKVWDQDLGNPCWLALTAAQQSHSTDGATWTAAAAHGLPSAPIDVCYSAHRSKWFALCANGRVYASPDNGVTWTAAVFTSGAVAPITTGRIVSDGFGELALACCDAATGAWELWASWDDGTTWARVYLEEALPGVGITLALWYSSGRFHLFATDGVGAFIAQVSLRGQE